MRVRRGVTLVEVLIAMFLTAIGLLAILTLFPLGALKMAEAIRADRAAYAAARAHEFAIAMDVRHDPLIYNPNGVPPPPFDLFISPQPPNPLFPDLSTIQGYDGGSYPIFMDAVGWGSNMFTPVGQYVNAPYASYGLTRSTASYASGAPVNYLPWFSLLDDLEFENDGPTAGLAKGTPNGGPLNLSRNTRFTWAYLLRRPRFSTPSVVELSVVLYDKRPIQSPSSEKTYAPGVVPGCNPVTVGATEVILTYTSAQDKPPIKKGGWILDATVNPTNTVMVNNTAVPSPDMQGIFYRVVDVTDLPTNPPSIALELDKPIRGGFISPQPPTPANRVFVILEGVIDVVEKGSGWKP